MKKAILMFLVLMVVPFVIASNTDFSPHYMQSQAEWSYYGNVYTINSYLLRSTAPDTDMNYNLDTWGFCSVTLGGSELGGIPITLLDSETSYKHRSFIVTYPTHIIQYGADCSIMDQYNMSNNRTIVSKMGAIRQYRNGDVYVSPSFSVVNYDNQTNYTYMTILSFDNETSNLILDQDVLISTSVNFTNASSNFGTSGGCFSSSSVNCIKNNRVFGIFNEINDYLYIINHIGGSWSLQAQVNLSTTYVNANVHDNHLFFNDYNADGNNEFILLGYVKCETTDVCFYGTRVQPLSTSPYYYEYSKLYLIDTAMNFQSNVILNDYQSITLCQVGDFNSEMEVCFLFNNGANQLYSGFLSNDFTAIYYSIASSEPYYKGTSPFTYDADGDDVFETDKHLCYIISGSVFNCYYNNGTLINTFNTSVSLVQAGNYKNLIVTELDGNISSPEIIYSSGEVETIVWGGTNILLTDWASTFDNSYYGELMVQDISTDEKSELIYIDDTFLRIYSNDNTPSVFMNWTYEEEILEDEDEVTAPPSDVHDFLEGIQLNLNLIIGLFIIVALMIAAAQMGIKNPLILAFIGIVGTIISAALHLISASVLVIVIVSLVVLLLLAITLFKSQGET